MLLEERRKKAAWAYVVASSAPGSMAPSMLPRRRHLGLGPHASVLWVMVPTLRVQTVIYLSKGLNVKKK
jgi:hypothetical protein